MASKAQQEFSEGPLAWVVFLFLVTGSGVYFLATLAGMPSSSAAGFSLQRIALLAVFGLLAFFPGLLLVSILSHASWGLRWVKLSRDRRFWVCGFILSVALLLVPQICLDGLFNVYRNSGIYSYQAYATRLAPLFNWLGIVGVLLAGLILWVSRRQVLPALGDQALPFRRWPWVWLGLGGVALLAAVTRLGLALNTPGSYGNPGVPLLEWQIGLAFLLCLALSVFSRRFFPNLPADRWIGPAIWGLAALVWAAQPLVPAYFATPPRTPNFEIYPFSDGATYDQYAQALLTGAGFGGIIPQRALYTVFLAFLHLVAGQDYVWVIFLQTLVLALLPAVFYLIGRELHGRFAGLFAALLVIFRELTAIRSAPFTDNISYSKLYFSELPTALCLAVFTLCFLRWAKDPHARLPYAVAAGGFLGMAMLIRTQSAAVLPFLLLIALFPMGRWRFRGWLRGVACLALGLAVCLAPWYARNWRISGGPALDNPESQTQVLAMRYNNLRFEETIPQRTGESTSAYSSRLTKMALQGFLAHPGDVARAVLAHFVNNEASNLLIFPIRVKMTSFQELIWPSFAFWQERLAAPSFAQVLLLVANLGLIAAALAAVTARIGLLGLAPLWLSLAYNFSTAVFLSSGERFLLPVDWVMVLYYAIGAAQCVAWCFALTGRRPVLPDSGAEKADRAAGPTARIVPWRIWRAAIPFLIVGLSLPLSEVIFPLRYPPQPVSSLQNRLVQASGENASAVTRFLAQPGAEIIQGRALYPRYYRQGESEPKTAKPGYAGMDAARLVFYIVGPQNGLVVFPSDLSPAYFPNASDVLVAGCRRADYFQAVWAWVDRAGGPVYQASPGSLPDCSQP